MAPAQALLESALEDGGIFPIRRTVMSKRNVVLASFVALALAGAGLPALAQTSAPPKKSKEDMQAAMAKWEAQFKAADKNGDGGLSKDELNQAKGFPHIKQNFDAMDTNKDGKVTIEEHHAWEKANRAAKKK
jgi:EF hand domain-containing protein